MNTNSLKQQPQELHTTSPTNYSKLYPEGTSLILLSTSLVVKCWEITSRLHLSTLRLYFPEH